MKILPFVFGILALAAVSTTSARARVSVSVTPYGYGEYAPGIYHSDPYYDPYYGAPPVVYFGGGYWGDGRGRHRGDRHDDQGWRHWRGRDDRGERRHDR
jgi:hypothetical protein